MHASGRNRSSHELTRCPAPPAHPPARPPAFCLRHSGLPSLYQHRYPQQQQQQQQQQEEEGEEAARFLCTDAGDSLLMLAVFTRQRPMAALLVAAGAHWDLPNGQGETPASVAVDVGFEFVENGMMIPTVVFEHEAEAGRGERRAAKAARAAARAAAKAEQRAVGAARAAGQRIARRREAAAEAALAALGAELDSRGGEGVNAV